MARQKKIEKEIEKIRKQTCFIRVLNGLDSYLIQCSGDDSMDGFEEIDLDAPAELEENSTDRIIREFKELHGHELVGLSDMNSYLEQRYAISDELYDDFDQYDDYEDDDPFSDQRRNVISFDNIMAAFDMLCAKRNQEPEGYCSEFTNEVYFKVPISEGPDDPDLVALLEVLSNLFGTRAYALLPSGEEVRLMLADHSIFIGTSISKGQEFVTMVATYSGLYEVAFFDEREDGFCKTVNPLIDQRLKDSLGFCLDEDFTNLYKTHILDGEKMGIEERFYFPGKFFL